MPTRRWLIPGSLYAATAAQAKVAGVPMTEWVREALREWVRDLDLVRITTPEVDDEVEELPDASVEDLATLARDPSPRRLNLWLALLAEARWPVPQLAAPVLGVTVRSVEKRVQQGYRMIDADSPESDLDELLLRIPAVPAAPESAVLRPDSREPLQGLSVQLRDELWEKVAEKATWERLNASQAVRTALRERLARFGIDANGQPLPPQV